ncbi:MAG: porin [Pseudomonadota bacterium]
MNKNFIIAIVAGALSSGALAQSVVISGLVDAYAGSVQSSGSKRVSAVNSSGMSTSWWGVDGKEDLGNGLKAEFKLAAYFRNDTGVTGRFNGNETFFSKNAFVGLSGDFGTIRLGRDGAPNFLPTALFNAFGDSFTFSPLVLHADVPLYNGTGWDSVNAGDTGWSNQVRYTTPNVGGLTANLHYQFGEVAGNNSKHNVGASFLYFNGRFGLGGFVHQVRMDNPLAGTIGNVKLGFSQQDAWMLSGKAGFGPVNLYANYERARNDNDGGAPGNARSKTCSVSADLAVGQGKLLAAFAGTRWTASPTTVLNGSKRDTFSFGYDHDLSRRSDIYVVYMSDKISRYDRGDSFAVGMRHRF